MIRNFGNETIIGLGSDEVWREDVGCYPDGGSAN